MNVLTPPRFSDPAQPYFGRLFRAVVAGKAGKVRRMLAAGANPNARSARRRKGGSRTVLEAAWGLARWGVVDALLEHGAVPLWHHVLDSRSRSDGRTDVLLRAIQGSEASDEGLPARLGWTHPSKGFDHDALEFALAAGLRPHQATCSLLGRTLFDHAVGCGDEGGLALLLGSRQPGDPRAPLQKALGTAVFWNRAWAIAPLVGAGADPHARDWGKTLLAQTLEESDTSFGQAPYPEPIPHSLEWDDLLATQHALLAVGLSWDDEHGKSRWDDDRVPLHVLRDERYPGLKQYWAAAAAAATLEGAVPVQPRKPRRI